MSNHNTVFEDNHSFLGVELATRRQDTASAPAPTRIPACNLTTEVAASLLAETRSITGEIEVRIFGWPQWNSASRTVLCSLISELGSTVRIHVGDQIFTEFFAATLAMIPSPADLTQHASAVNACIEVAALMHPTSPEATAGQIRDRLLGLGVRGIRVSNLVSQIRALANVADEAASDVISYEAIADRFIETYRCQVEMTDRDLPVVAYYRGTMYQWSGRVWKEIEDRRFDMLVGGHLRQIESLAVTGKRISDIAINIKSLTLINDWQADQPFWIESLDPVELLPSRRIVLANGVINIDDIVTGGELVLEPHDSRYFNAVALNFEFDATATCPQWLAFLNEILPVTGPNDHRQDVLQECVGYTLLGDCRYQKMLVMVGEGRNGKSTVLDVWKPMLGRLNVAHVEYSQLGGDFRLGSLIGKAANFSSEIDHLGRDREGLLKQLIAGEPIDINRKFKDPISVKLFAKLVAACNDLPVISDTTLGLWRRLIVMPFDVVVPIEQVNPNLANELCEELAGILNWAIVGLRRLLQNDGFTSCDVCNQAVARHRIQSDSVAEFVHQFCCFDPAAVSIKARLFQVYKYATTELGGSPTRNSEFGKRLTRLGITNRRARPTEDSSRPYLVTGLRLNDAGQTWLDQLVQKQRLPWTSAAFRPSTAYPGNDASDGINAEDETD